MSAILTPKDEGTYSSRLSVMDRERLRKVVKKIHFQHYPTEFVTDREADKLIDAWGPVVGETVLREAIQKHGAI